MVGRPVRIFDSSDASVQWWVRTMYFYSKGDPASLRHLKVRTGEKRGMRVIYVRGVQSSWNVMAHDGAREEKWSGNWRMEWISGTLHTTSEHCVSSITTADAHTSAVISQLNWSPGRFKRTRPFRRKTNSGFCACAITFQKLSTTLQDSSQEKSIIDQILQSRTTKWDV